MCVCVCVCMCVHIFIQLYGGKKQLIIPSYHFTIVTLSIHTFYNYTVSDFMITCPRQTNCIVFIYSFHLIRINFQTHLNNIIRELFTI